MTTPLNLLANLLESFDPVESAKHSFKNYHAVGLTYINLLRTPRLTVKLYLTQPGVKHNAQGYLVNPHTHRYNFETYILAGWLDHTLFIENDSLPHNSRWCCFGYQSVLNGGNGFRLERVAGMQEDEYRLPDGHFYYLKTHQIHTIAVAPDSVTLQLQIQYHDLPNPVTRFYSKDPSPPSLDGLYVRMSAAEISEHMEEIKAICESRGYIPR